MRFCPSLCKKLKMEARLNKPNPSDVSIMLLILEFCTYYGFLINIEVYTNYDY